MQVLGQAELEERPGATAQRVSGNACDRPIGWARQKPPKIRCYLALRASWQASKCARLGLDLDALAEPARRGRASGSLPLAAPLAVASQKARIKRRPARPTGGTEEESSEHGRRAQQAAPAPAELARPIKGRSGRPQGSQPAGGSGRTCRLLLVFARPPSRRLAGWPGPARPAWRWARSQMGALQHTISRRFSVLLLKSSSERFI